MGVMIQATRAVHSLTTCCCLLLQPKYQPLQGIVVDPASASNDIWVFSESYLFYVSVAVWRHGTQCSTGLCNTHGLVP